MYKNNTFHIYGALGRIGDPESIPVLAKGLQNGQHYDQIPALDTILNIKAQTGLSHAMSETDDTNAKIRRNAVIKCIQANDKAAIQPLKALTNDEDFEVRKYQAGSETPREYIAFIGGCSRSYPQ